MLYRMEATKTIALGKNSVRRGKSVVMKCVTYNVHFGVGMDGKYDLDRIVSAVRGADVIALQEVSRNNPQNGGVDMVAELGDLLPEYFTVFGSPYQVNFGSHMADGKAASVYFEFGNMVLSKTPIISSRNLLLPRIRTYDIINLQRGALEAMVETPLGAVRFYSVHLDHVSERERLAQIAFLKERVLSYQREGGAVTGLSSMGFPEPPHPEHAVLMGDFNLLPESPDYVALCGRVDGQFGRQRCADDFCDVSIPQGMSAEDSHTWFDPEGKQDSKRIDYCLVTASLAERAGNARVDTASEGSDHRPVWIGIE